MFFCIIGNRVCSSSVEPGGRINGASEHEGRPPFRYNSRGSTQQPRDSSAVRVTCWHCGQRGHYSSDCPNPPTDRKSEPSAGPSTTMGPTLPSAQPTALHPKRGRQGTGAASPAVPTRGPTPQLTKKNHPSWTPLVPIRQTAPTTRTPFVHS